jgi:hypothetical protein
VKLPKIPYLWLLVSPYLLFAFGFALNALVCAVNGSSMPVQVPAADMANGCPIDPSDWIHHCMTAQSHLKFLADVIAVRGLGIASVGDFFEWGGETSMVPAFFMWLGALYAKYDVKD